LAGKEKTILDMQHFIEKTEDRTHWYE